jgi:hypothetical protein
MNAPHMEREEVPGNLLSETRLAFVMKYLII